MKTLFIILSLVTIFTVRANSNITLKITTDSELTAIATGKFVAQKDTFRCTDFSWNEGSMTRVAEVRFPEFYAKNNVVTIPFYIDSKCNFERVGGASLGLELKGEAKNINVVTVFFGGGNSEVQEVKCEKYVSGPDGNERPVISCFGDIRTNDEGFALVNVILE